MSVRPRPLADWSKYETNEISPGVFALDAKQSEDLIRETMPPNEKPCPGCGRRVFGAVCRRCDMLQPV